MWAVSVNDREMPLVEEMCERLGISSPWDEPLDPRPFDGHGWFESQTQLTRMAAELGQVRWALELGSWLGASTRFLAGCCELVVAVDHWRGSPEHFDPARPRVARRVPTLYPQFMSNCRALSARILPLRMSTEEAFALFRARGVVRTFDLIYVDAAHDPISVVQDLRGATEVVSPRGIICGDDWEWGGETGPVRAGVTAFANERGLGIETDGNFWRLAAA